MFAALRRAWQRYVASLPTLPVEEPVSDTDAIKELRPPPLDRAIVSAFGELATHVLSHVAEDMRSRHLRTLSARLKRDRDPAEALSAWIRANTGPWRNVGVMSLDWKAREDVLWHAQHLCAAHGVSMDWTYDHETDTEWRNWQERNEFPVDSPLRDFAVALKQSRIELLRFAVDDGVYAFAVPRDRADEVLALGRTLGIALIREG